MQPWSGQSVAALQCCTHLPRISHLTLLGGTLLLGGKLFPPADTRWCMRKACAGQLHRSTQQHSATGPPAWQLRCAAARSRTGSALPGGAP
jgi:hypothetical protein